MYELLYDRGHGEPLVWGTFDTEEEVKKEVERSQGAMCFGTLKYRKLPSPRLLSGKVLNVTAE